MNQIITRLFIYWRSYSSIINKLSQEIYFQRQQSKANKESYSNKWYDFVGTSDRLGGVYPYFFELDLGNDKPPVKEDNACLIAENYEDGANVTPIIWDKLSA